MHFAQNNSWEKDTKEKFNQKYIHDTFVSSTPEELKLRTYGFEKIKGT